MMSRFFLKAVLASTLVSVSLGACGSQDVATSGKNTVVSGKAAIGGAYTLVDHTGKTVSEQTYLGRPQLIYFGFAYCPDVCPTALQQMGAALYLAESKSPGIETHYQSLFITIDAERDTVEKMALYVTASGFPNGLIGLTGSAEQLKQAQKAYAVIGEKVEDSSNPDGYTYDHSSLIYLMDDKGEFVDIFTHADTPQKIAERLIAFKKTGR